MKNHVLRLKLSPDIGIFLATFCQFLARYFEHWPLTPRLTSSAISFDILSLATTPTPYYCPQNYRANVVFELDATDCNVGTATQVHRSYPSKKDF